MGTSSSIAELAGKFSKLADGVRDPTIPLGRTALAVKRIMESSAASAGVLGTIPTGKRKSLQVRYNLHTRATSEGVAVISYTGAAHLLNNPTTQHFIGPRGFGSVAALRRLGAGVGAVTSFGGSGRGIFAGAGGDRGFQLTRGGSLVRRRRRGGRALVIEGDFTSYAFHPGTAGKAFFQRAKPAAVKAGPRVYARAGLTEPLRQAFAA